MSPPRSPCVRRRVELDLKAKKKMKQKLLQGKLIPWKPKEREHGKDREKTKDQEKKKERKRKKTGGKEKGK